MEINLKDYYYWYITDELINVSEEIAAEEAVTCRAVQASIQRGLKAMRKYF